MRALVLVVVMCVACVAPAAARWAEYLPAESWVDEDLAILRAGGFLRDVPLVIRPLTRGDVADALLRSWNAQPDLAGDPVFQRLVREFAREITEGDARRPDAPRETPPLVDLSADEGVTMRGSVYAAALARTSPDSSTELHPGTRVGGRVTLRIAPGIVVHEDWTAGRVQNARRYSDYLLGIRDFASELPRAYVSAALGTSRVQLGRDAARWGPGLSGTLLLSDASGSATMFSGTTTLWRTLTLAARTHVLSAERGRYFSAHAIEWRPGPCWTVALSEAAVYTSRSPELLYVLGFIPYTTVQRLATEDAGDAFADPLRNNVTAGVDVAWRPAAGYEFRTALLVDDVQLSSQTTPNRGGVQVGLTRTARLRGTQRVSVRAEYTRVAAHTYSVYYSVDGDRDFLFHDRSLGYALGPDAESALLRAEWDPSRALRVEARAEQTRTGAGGLAQPWRPGDPTDDAWRMRTPVERRRSVVALARVQPTDAVHVQAALGALFVQNDAHLAERTRRGVVGWIGWEVRR